MKTTKKIARYGGSLALVLAIHGAVIAFAMHDRLSQAVELPPQAIQIELAPLPLPAPPPPPAVKPQPPVPEEVPLLPKLAEAPKPEIALPPPVKPKPKPKPEPKKPVVEKRPEPPQPEKPVEQKAPQAPPSNAPVEKSAAPAPSVAPAPSNALPNWQSALLGHIGKYKTYPEEARSRGKEGTSLIRMVIDANGNVLSSTLVGSSGNAALDRAALESIRKAQPLPKPPAELLSNGEISVTAPFAFTIDKRRR